MTKIFKPISKEEFKKRFIKHLLSKGCYETNLGWNCDYSLNIYNMNLTEIPVKFYKINGSFSCSFNKLKTLKNCPKIVNGSFYCYSNQLISLEYCPQIINGHFNCSNNNLISLEHCPKEINGYFYCMHNPLKSEEYNCKISVKIYF